MLIGTSSTLSRGLFWNEAVIRSNEFHTYFRVNSIFWDPNIYGRYLALVLVVVTAAMMWVKERRAFWLLCGVILLLWIGLAQTFTQSSFIALLAGLAVLAALRWTWRWTLAVALVAVLGGALVVVLVGGKGISSNRLNIDPPVAAISSPAAPNCSPNGRCGATDRVPSSTPTATTWKPKRRRR